MEINGMFMRGAKDYYETPSPTEMVRLQMGSKFNIREGAAICVLKDGRVWITPVTSESRQQQIQSNLESLGFQLEPLSLPKMSPDRFKNPKDGEQWQTLVNSQKN